MREESSAAKGMFILSFAGIMAKVMSVVYTPFLREILGLEGYGVYSKTTEVFLFIYALSCMGAQPAVAKVVAEYTALNDKKAAVKSFKVGARFYGLLGVLLGTFMFFLSTPLAKIAQSERAALGIKALAPCIVVTSLLAVCRGFMQGKSDMTSIAVSQILEQFLNVIISLLCAFILVQSSLELGNAGAQIGTTVGALFACFYIIYCYEKKRYGDVVFTEESKSKVKNKEILKRLLRYSIPITVSAGLQNFGGIVDMINVSTRLVDIGYAQEQADALYGLLGQYRTIYGVPLVIITAIGTTVLPTLAKLIILKERKEAKKKISYAFKMAFMISVPATVGLSVLSNEVYVALFNDGYGSDIMKYGSIVLVLMSITQIQSTVLQGINKMYYVLGSFCVGIVAKIIANYIFVGIPSLNIYGAIIGNCVWHLIPGIINHKKICSVMKMRMPILRLSIRPIIASLGMAMVIFICKQPLNFLYRFIPLTRMTAMPITVMLVGIGAFVYLYLMIAIGGIRKRDIELISPKIFRLIPRFMRIKLK